MNNLSLKEICDEAPIRENNYIIEKALDIYELLKTKVKFAFLKKTFDIYKDENRLEYFRLDGSWVCEINGISYFLECDSPGSIYNFLSHKEEIEKKKNKTNEDLGILAKYALFDESINKIKNM